jgi:flagellin-like protein
MSPIRKIYRDRSGVSPVIAVILMVAITVVLAGVLYVWVMGLATTTERTPTCSFRLELGDDLTSYSQYENISKIFRDSGDKIKWSKIRILCSDTGGSYFNVAPEAPGSQIRIIIEDSEGMDERWDVEDTLFLQENGEDWTALELYVKIIYRPTSTTIFTGSLDLF